jgi:hypothetical protein
MGLCGSPHRKQCPREGRQESQSREVREVAAGPADPHWPMGLPIAPAYSPLRGHRGFAFLGALREKHCLR